MMRWTRSAPPRLGRLPRRTRWPPSGGCSWAVMTCSTSWRPRPGCSTSSSWHGPGGTGKTELAKGFARWWRDTGGTSDPRLLCWHSFEPGVASFGLDGVITSIGLGVFGADFARLEAPERLAAVKRLLGQYRGLLVWDNFESVAEMPDPAGATPPLDEAGRAQLREFLHWVRDQSRSAVLITSRAREDWLGDVRRIAVGGLNRAEAAEYAGLLLAPFPAAQRRRQRPSFGELLDWLDGHPLSMRLTLPRLENSDPSGLLAALRGTAPLPTAEDVGAGQAVIAGRVHHLLLRPPDRPGQAASSGHQPVHRHCRRGRSDALFRR